METERKGKAPMPSVQSEESVGDEYLEIKARILKNALVIKSKSLATRMVKMILLPRSWEDRKNHPLEENIGSFYRGLIKVSTLLRTILRIPNSK